MKIEKKNYLNLDKKKLLIIISHKKNNVVLILILRYNFLDYMIYITSKTKLYIIRYYKGVLHLLFIKLNHRCIRIDLLPGYISR